MIVLIASASVASTFSAIVAAWTPGDTRCHHVSPALSRMTLPSLSVKLKLVTPGQYECLKTSST